MSRAKESKTTCPMRRLIFSSRVAAIAGIVGPLVAFIGIAVAILMSASWFNWVSNALSDLGHPFMLGGSHGIPGLNPSAPIFNLSLIACGLITLPMAARLIALQRNLKSILGMLGGILLVIAEVFLIGIGVFNESTGSIHFWVSVGFFVNILLFGLVYGIMMMTAQKTRLFGMYTFILAFVSAAIWIVYFTPFTLWTGPAIPETASAVATLAWVFPLCVRLYRQGAE
jgi:hypothetical membrane protein